jgi:hypothetical protein
MTPLKHSVSYDLKCYYPKVFGIDDFNETKPERVEGALKSNTMLFANLLKDLRKPPSGDKTSPVRQLIVRSSLGGDRMNLAENSKEKIASEDLLQLPNVNTQIVASQLPDTAGQQPKLQTLQVVESGLTSTQPVLQAITNTSTSYLSDIATRLSANNRKADEPVSDQLLMQLCSQPILEDGENATVSFAPKAVRAQEDAIVPLMDVLDVYQITLNSSQSSRTAKRRPKVTMFDGTGDISARRDNEHSTTSNSILTSAQSRVLATNILHKTLAQFQLSTSYVGEKLAVLVNLAKEISIPIERVRMTLAALASKSGLTLERVDVRIEGQKLPNNNEVRRANR